MLAAHARADALYLFDPLFKMVGSSKKSTLIPLLQHTMAAS